MKAWVLKWQRSVSTHAAFFPHTCAIIQAVSALASPFWDIEQLIPFSLPGS